MIINDDEFQFAFAQASYNDVMREKEEEKKIAKQQRIKFLTKVSWFLGITLLIVHVYLLRISTLIITATYESEIALGFAWAFAVMGYIFAWYTVVRILMQLPKTEKVPTIPFILLAVNWAIAYIAGIVMLGEFVYK